MLNHCATAGLEHSKKGCSRLEWSLRRSTLRFLIFPRLVGWFNCWTKLVGQLVLVMAIQPADEWSNKLFLTGNHLMESGDRAGSLGRALRWEG